MLKLETELAGASMTNTELRDPQKIYHRVDLDGLKKLAPTFRFGPVLVDPKRIRMPVASDIRGPWSFSHRVDAATWADDAVVNSTSDAQLPPDPSEGREGWLKLTPPED